MPEEVKGFLSREKRMSNSKTNEEEAFAKPESGRITSLVENRLITKYRESTTDNSHTPPRRIPIPLKAPGNLPLDGFYFKYEDGLKDFLQREDFVGIYFGIGEDESTNSHTLIIYGVTNDDVGLILHRENLEMYDLCDPCPPRCSS